MRTGPLGVVLGLVACQTPPLDGSADRSRYLAVLSQRRIEPEPGLEQCRAIDDSTLAGDCALYVVMVESRRPEGAPARWCEQVPAGTWRDECWFVAGEKARRDGKLEASARYCMEAGAFKDDCAQHLWQSEVHRLIHRRGSGAFGEALPAAESVYGKWAPLLAAQSDFDARFWAKFFQNGFEGQGGFVDLSHCDALPEPHNARCVEAGTEMYARELSPRLSDFGVDLCTLDAPEDGGWSQLLAQWVPTRPDARLDAVVRDRRSDCAAR